MMSISLTYLLYFVPLLIAISLVYAATRHEDMQLIRHHALHTAYWITVFMGSIFLVLFILGLLV